MQWSSIFLHLFNIDGISLINFSIISFENNKLHPCTIVGVKIGPLNIFVFANNSKLFLSSGNTKNVLLFVLNQ